MTAFRRVGLVCAAMVVAGPAFSGCRGDTVPYATRADVYAGHTDSVAVKAPVNPTNGHLVPALEIGCHLSAIESGNALAGLADALGETPEDLCRKDMLAGLMVGDRIRVIIGNDANASLDDVCVAADGTIVVPSAGVMNVLGRSTDEVASEMSARLASGGAEKRVSVCLKTAVPRYVTVVGGLPKAGRVELSGQSTLIEALTAAGFDPGGSPASRIALMRRGRTGVIDAKRLCSLQGTSQNVTLRPDDIVMLLESVPVRVAGSVANPGSFPLGDRTAMSIQEVLSCAGWFTDRADLARAQVVKSDGTTIKADLNGVLFGHTESPELMLHPGDTLVIPTSREVGIYILGMVDHPGLHRMKENATVLQALAVAQPAQFGAVLSAAKVVRDFPNNPKVVTVDMDKLFYRGDLTQNLVLESGDIVFVPESAGSDVLDSITRAFAPITGSKTQQLNSDDEGIKAQDAIKYQQVR
jgi:protein involved in polysaccharide export with SLBB domain